VNGQEAIFLKNGGSVEIVARSKNSARGFTVDVLVMDEAQEMSDDDLEALMPTTSAAPLGNPQWIFTGTPPGPNANGEVFTASRNEALSGKSKRLAWHEWSASRRPVDLDDRDEWRGEPGAGHGRLQFEVIEGERPRFSDDGFARERLGMWAAPARQAVIDAESWAAVATPRQCRSSRCPRGRRVPGSDDGVGGARWPAPDGSWHVELDEQRRGVGWIVPWIVARCERNKIRAVVIDGMSPAASLVDELSRRREGDDDDRARHGAGVRPFYDGVMERVWRTRISRR
jgi:hypothetical protein